MTEAVERAAGVLAVVLSLDSAAYLLWFRRAQIVPATCGGNPSADAMSAGADGVNPRASFEACKQDIHNLSRSWLTEDVQIADKMAEVVRGLTARPPFRPAASEPARRRSWLRGRVPPWPVRRIPIRSPSSAPASSPHREIRIGQR